MTGAATETTCRQHRKSNGKKMFDFEVRSSVRLPLANCSDGGGWKQTLKLRTCPKILAFFGHGLQVQHVDIVLTTSPRVESVLMLTAVLTIPPYAFTYRSSIKFQNCGRLLAWRTFPVLVNLVVTS